MKLVKVAFDAQGLIVLVYSDGSVEHLSDYVSTEQTRKVAPDLMERILQSLTWK